MTRLSEQLDLANLEELQRCADYRAAALRVRAAAGRTLVAGILVLLIVAGILADGGPTPGLIAAVAFALPLSAGGLLNLLRPQAVWLLVDGALLLILLVVVGYTAFVEAQGVPASLLRITDLALAALVIWVLSNLQRFPRHRKALAVRPARALLAFVRDLAAEVRDADIGEDYRLIELWGRPCWKGRLVRGVGVFADAAGREMRFATRGQVELVIDEAPAIGTKPLYVLRVRNDVLVGRMDAVSHRRYLAWKSGISAGCDEKRTAGRDDC